MGAVCEKVYQLCTDPRLNSHPTRRLQAITAAGHLAAGCAHEATKAALVHILLAQTPAGAPSLHLSPRLPRKPRTLPSHAHSPFASKRNGQDHLACR